MAGPRDPVVCEEMINYSDKWRCVCVINILNAPKMSLALGKVRRAQRARCSRTCASRYMPHRHGLLTRIAREAGFSTATEQFAAEPFSQNTARPPHRRGDVRVTATATEPASYFVVVVSSAPHWREGQWHVGGQGIAFARKERDKLRRWDVQVIDGHGVRVIPLSTEM